MTVGFTGTRKGMTDAQKVTVKGLLDTLKRGLIQSPIKLAAHHGDCVGADADFHTLAKLAGFEIYGHPCDIQSQRAYCDVNFWFEEKHPLVRNHDIINCSGVLIACPGKPFEELRSGTWATIRYAKRENCPLVIVWPDGTMERFNGA